MSNGARHVIGVVLGLIVTPLVAVGMAYGVDRMRLSVQRDVASLGGSADPADKWGGAALLLAVAIALGLVTASRLSPLASLIPGVTFTGIGILWLVDPSWAVRYPTWDFIPSRLFLPYTTLGMFGIFLLLGVLLIAASVFPSRWQARTGAAPRYGSPPPAPMGPPPMHGVPPVIGGSQPPQAPGQSSPPWQGTPQYGQAPAASNPPPLPAAPPASSASPASESPRPSSRSGSDDDDEPGDWTRMYGGNR
ncbi:hypothetical protein [Actinomadura sp. 3N508]|uniref:hypothetical protein n=1 Tax=Actinomadura sp. 3N508 TaxID=3375153 RepID=UPI0037B7F85E